MKLCGFTVIPTLMAVCLTTYFLRQRESERNASRESVEHSSNGSASGCHRRQIPEAERHNACRRNSSLRGRRSVCQGNRLREIDFGRSRLEGKTGRIHRRTRSSGVTSPAGSSRRCVSKHRVAACGGTGEARRRRGNIPAHACRSEDSWRRGWQRSRHGSKDGRRR